ncbi:S-adenosyl-L-methionine-dependent methyltransferase [Sordaria brevicollis]|uniref:S-adenosyl-L-methionine-dependent methyltransferase n=1 Tax=Sordaria brevicollis TaxID=83679 RepID=A0AAE0PGU8_SORBR|nr:S-adenosyl-L-methionine-dependent methyltransferase [Sordaria brevicollis]
MGTTSPKSPRSTGPQSPKSKEASPSPPPGASVIEPLNTEEQQAAGLLPAAHWQQQALAEEEDDDGSSIITDFASTTASLSSSIFNYRTLHGRTYHGEIGNAESWEPNDQRHVEALDVLHHALMVQLDGKLFLSPLNKEKVQKVLDIATGSGLWAIDFADEFPNAEVIGTDVSPIQPTWVPPNVKFELDDCNAEWTYADDTFDFINMRQLVGIVDDWNKLFRNAFRCCKPGGYVESMASCVEFLSDDGSVKPGSAIDQWGKLFREGGKKFGRSFAVYEEDLQRVGMEAAGFVDIEFKDIMCPLGVWHPDKKAAERGLWYKLAGEADLEGYLNYVANVVMGWSPEETKFFAAQVRKEWNDPKIHGYFWFRVVYGRKPE